MKIPKLELKNIWKHLTREQCLERLEHNLNKIELFTAFLILLFIITRNTIVGTIGYILILIQIWIIRKSIVKHLKWTGDM